MPINTMPRLLQNSGVLLAVLIVQSVILCSTNAFAPSLGAVSRPDWLQPRTSCFAADDDAVTEYSAMSEAEIKTLLDAVPVYAVTEANNDGIVLLKEQGNDNEIAYFFFSPEIANSVYAPLKAKKQGDVNWDVTRFPLGLIWFDLMKNPKAGTRAKSVAIDGIEYRLIPDGRELGAARNILEQQIRQESKEEVPDILIPDTFKSSYNEIPIFIDQFLRISSDDESEKVPMYFGMQDLIQTCQQAADASSGEYKASINIADLHSMVAQMQGSSPVNFREAMMIPPTPQPLPEAANEPIKAETKSDEMELPTATDMWAD